MTVNTSTSGPLDSEEGLKIPSIVNIEDVESVLGKGIGALHFRSGYGDKNFSTFFEYSPVTMDKVVSELSKYKVEPKVFQGIHSAAEYIRNNSMFPTDTYILELPGDIVIVYQLTLIREIFDSCLKITRTGYAIQQIIDFVNYPWLKQYDMHGIRKPGWMGVGDNGLGVDLLYIDTSSMNSRDELRIIQELPNPKNQPID